MNAAGPVLRDIHVAPASWWPPAPGWWLLAALLVLVALGLVAVARWRARRRPLRIALGELDALARGYCGEGDAARVLDRASRLMRRIAHRIEPSVASQTGEAWRAFVRRYSHDAHAAAVLDALLDARFRRSPDLDIGVLLDVLRRWCSAALRHPGARLRVARRGARSA